MSHQGKCMCSMLKMTPPLFTLDELPFVRTQLNYLAPMVLKSANLASQVNKPR